MQLTIPTLLTLARILMIPVLVLVFYLPVDWSNIAAVTLFILAGLTDWLDGWVARRFRMTSSFGAFLDPVADKLMVGVALIIIVQRHPEIGLALSAAVIIGREITISALREWMAAVGESGRVKVAWAGKIKTILQMVAIGFLLYGEPLGPIPVLDIGRWLLIGAAALTIWSMLSYLRSAWPAMRSRP
ncbi:CDP-diacylglycerol--glycerol-3-phosphate 3-phosphatidyltransferase [Wenzhouxiangella marina]|uniref:CDP-diacylglycerol--glycerol-3-phosphate 3-phosphatidyltransferase n=1 Tax=Wenzhouxiangella marina TaxID=1579979 RepID=A0A0K0XWY4_9GAMM|nr:CDP-diacylglycerol--glycerol-3-phosphate 3-phosphatidyltransferase [Wenzhouxiangella marina]AKS42185.1 CDP-diacylglycerol-glycerol-3-phosphate 3-phosphatidyltransferase [Wenzhouxiangella marina]MBB6086043.1 CDP-diacylglycerol--glycerol-3-phosphate 3-phosphatidyltransferase [Wenzhouxiangella marina]